MVIHRRPIYLLHSKLNIIQELTVTNRFRINEDKIDEICFLLRKAPSHFRPLIDLAPGFIVARVKLFNRY